MLRFSNERIDIPVETKITLWRFNKGNHSPYMGGDPWDLSAKSVSEISGAGVYGVWDENLRLTGNITLFQAFEAYKDQVFIEMEADRRDIVLINGGEITVSRCNIVRQLTAEEFAQEFPIYEDAYFWNRAVFHAESPHDLNSYKDKAYTRFYHRYMNKAALSIYSKNTAMHGYAHSLRVERNLILLEKHYKFNVSMREFAYYHDIARVSDGNDPEHGKRAVEVLRRARQHPNMVGMAAFDKLCFACEHHTTMPRSGDPLIDICFDADRLDLMRCGIQPDPKAMATHIGAHYAENYNIYVAEFQNIET